MSTISLCQQTLRISKGCKVEVLKLDDGMENLLYLEYICNNLNFQIWSLYAHSRDGYYSFTR